MQQYKLPFGEMPLEDRLSFIEELSKAGWEFVVMDSEGSPFMARNQGKLVLEFLTVAVATTGRTIRINGYKVPENLDQCHSLIVWQDCYDMLKKAGII